ncbi:MAG: HNH endonuclease [Opitutae bacterium]|nr:HNH endonuclease [Opitutae bacterium]
MTARDHYSRYLRDAGIEGSNKASSYIRALELLGPILAKTQVFRDCADVFAVESPERIGDLYEHVLEQQRREDAGMFGGEAPASYWRGGFYSAALRSYQEFLILAPYKQKLWALAQQGGDPGELVRRLNEQEIGKAERLLVDRGVDYASREGKDRICSAKARVNQDFFRELILDEYRTQCCVSGLNVPEVLRASHIIGWADDEANRLNPANGLCLSATYDAAFDRHLISFDEDYRMVFSPVLNEYYGNQAFQVQFRAFEGQPLSMPKRFRPDQEFLRKHCEKMPN